MEKMSLQLSNEMTECNVIQVQSGLGRRNMLRLEVVHAWFVVGNIIGNLVMTLPNQSQQYIISA